MPPDPNRPTRIFITAGDPSGDAHAARLMAEIRKRIPDVVFEGFGGPAMELEGLRSLAHIRDLAVTGFWEVAKRYRFFRDLMKRCERAIERSRPVLFIPVDYPGFNLRLAAKVRSHRLRVAWYIAPQLWAWGEKRAKDLAAAVDRLLVVFPFEVEFFSRHGIRAEYVGHPLSESIDPVYAPTRSATEVLLMPGSRKQEVLHHSPLLAETINRLQRTRPDLTFVVAQARNVDLQALKPLIDVGATISTNAERSMATATAGLIKAGTSTLEAAMRGLPFATYYRTSMLTYEVSKRLVNVTSVTMMNLLLNRPVIHEYIQGDATAKNLELEVIDLVSNVDRRMELTQAMNEVRSLLSGGGASANAATIIAEMVNR
ncbi:MAG: lipid-A-disaccharide synthase [Ignavibacteria bacterium]|nr:lipid-A-disaccharide synthase [Ignavibacteria bacterium]MBK6419625.1 lipid-A-disaccharide synthase [Ignavibacteria bacterium]MBK7413436.1 lipid-A-disaccharide synthase [Ignavibacteria bacterium]MBP7092963.1 lipid-A-disaccharide synthase [Candidatus Kapabacteria bacterium]